MRSIVLLAVVALGAPGALPRTDAPAGGSGFGLTIERDGGIWKAACEKGCEWREVRFECLEGPCSVTLDANGIAGGEAVPEADAAFAFILSPARGGWHASAIRGTSWTKLSWGCTVRMFCEAHVSEGGVRRP
jgi:hypothetical protein